ncbi:MAG: iron ABC transporter permease [Candidatus Omnitrophota bacterium]
MKKMVFLPALVAFAAIVILPFAVLLATALIHEPEMIRQLVQIFATERSTQLLRNSLWVGSGATGLAVLIGLPLGFFLARTNIHFRRVAGYLYLLPLLIPAYVAAIVWTSLLGANGSIHAWLVKYFGLAEGSLLIYGRGGAAWVLGLSYFPFITLLTISGLLGIDRRLEEAARMIVGEWRILKGITLPLIVPFVIAGALFVFVFTVSNYTVPALLRVNTYPIEIFSQFSAFYNHNRAVLTSLPLLGLTGILIAISQWLMRGRCYVTLEGISRRSARMDLGRWRGWGSLYVWLIIFLAGVLPLGVLIASSSSMNSYLVAFRSSGRPILTSLWVSGAAASLAVILGFFLAYIIERWPAKWKNHLDILTLLPLAVPPTVLGIGLIKLWNRPSTEFIYSNFLIVIFALVGCFIPFAVKTLTSSFKQLNINMEEAAILSGAGFGKTIAFIVLPLAKKGLVVSWTICFIFCMGECAATLLVVPAGVELLANKIYTLMHYGVGKLTSALCVILIFCTMIPILFVGWLFRKDLRHD